MPLRHRGPWQELCTSPAAGWGPEPKPHLDRSAKTRTAQVHTVPYKGAWANRVEGERDVRDVHDTTDPRCRRGTRARDQDACRAVHAHSTARSARRTPAATTRATCPTIGGSRRALASQWSSTCPGRPLATLGWTDDTAVPPGYTRVVLRHHDLPDDEQRSHHRLGWEIYLGRPGVSVLGGNPGTDSNAQSETSRPQADPCPLLADCASDPRPGATASRTAPAWRRRWFRQMLSVTDKHVCERAPGPVRLGPVDTP